MSDPIPETNPNTVIYDIPIEKTLVYYIKRCEYTISNLIANTSCQIIVQCFNEKDQSVRCVSLLLDGEAYLQWGSNDDYLTNWIKEQINNLP